MVGEIKNKFICKNGNDLEALVVVFFVFETVPTADLLFNLTIMTQLRLLTQLY